MKIVFSILHYQSIDVTIKCIESLKKYLNEDVKVVVVDNASPNNTGIKLEQKYNDNDYIEIIKSKLNQGFAKGNNIGYAHAKHNLNADFIIVMNNDVIIDQDNFIDIIVAMEKHNVHLIAPDIITPSEYHQNPFRMNKISTSKIIFDLIYNKISFILYKIPVLNIQIVNILERRRKGKILKQKCNINIQTQIVPHGAIIIYTKHYIKNEEYAFIPITFLFGEEDILYDYILKKGYKTIYFPDLKVLHLQDISINEITKDIITKRRFMSFNKIDSLKNLLKIRVCNK